MEYFIKDSSGVLCVGHPCNGWYRSRHNELDSKSCWSGVWLTAETVGITGFLGMSTFFYGSISTDFLRFFYAFYAVFGHCGGRANRWKYTIQRYRRGHNGADSKTKGHFGTCSRKNLDVSTVSGYYQRVNFSQFSPSVLSFFQGPFLRLMLRKICGGIEVVITGLIRNPSKSYSFGSAKPKIE